MPLLTPRTNLSLGATIQAADFNTPFNALFGLVNGGGTAAGIDSANISSLSPGPVVNPGAFPGNFIFTGNLSPAAAAYWSLQSAAVAAPGAVVAGDVVANQTATTGSIVFKTSVASISLTQSNNTLSFGAGKNVLLPTATSASNQAQGNAIPWYTSTGATPPAGTRIVMGQVNNNGGYSGTIVPLTASTPAAFTNSSSYIVVAYGGAIGTTGVGLAGVIQNSGTQFTVYTWTGNGGNPTQATVNWIAIGN